MPRARRDYAAEYRRRIERAQQQAAARGETFDKAKARGHRSREEENRRRRVYRLIDSEIRRLRIMNEDDGIVYANGEIDAAIAERGAIWVLGRLREQRLSIEDWVRRLGPDDPRGRLPYRRTTKAEKKATGRTWILVRAEDRKLETLFFYHGNY